MCAVETKIVLKVETHDLCYCSCTEITSSKCIKKVCLAVHMLCFMFTDSSYCVHSCVQCVQYLVVCIRRNQNSIK